MKQRKEASNVLPFEKKTEIPDGFRWTAQHKSFAAKFGLEITSVLADFVAKEKAVNNKSENWDASLMGYIGGLGKAIEAQPKANTVLWEETPSGLALIARADAEVANDADLAARMSRWSSSQQASIRQLFYKGTEPSLEAAEAYADARRQESLARKALAA